MAREEEGARPKTTFNWRIEGSGKPRREKNKTEDPVRNGKVIYIYLENIESQQFYSKTYKET